MKFQLFITSILNVSSIISLSCRAAAATTATATAAAIAHVAVFMFRFVILDLFTLRT